MFRGCSSLNNLNGIGKWNVSNGEDFSDMFQGCLSLKV
jgi:surface protein